MYQNMAWPGAYEFKGEMKFFVESVQQLFADILKNIEKTEKVISVGEE
ncbi:hypothetical protein KBA27_02625 [bacterium]|nr:hypothetical protein [bacterium]